MIVVVAGTKGGSGKTTCATNLVVERAKETEDVLFIDADQQGTSKIWSAVRADSEISPVIPCAHIYDKGTDFPGIVKQLNSQYGDVIIDVGGRNTKELRASLVIADVVIIPVKPSPADIWALEQTERLFEAVKQVNPLLKGIIVINSASTSPPKTEAEELEEMCAPFTLLDYSGVVIRNRIAFTRALNEGLGISEYEPKDEKAIHEIITLYNLVYENGNSTKEDSAPFADFINQ